MSGSNSSEEKTHPASSKKLAEARKKGQIARSVDFASALTTAAMMGYVWLSAGGVVERLQHAMAVAEAASTTGFDDALREIAVPLLLQMAVILVPILALSAGSAVVANVFGNGGVLFTLHPLLPKLETINPVSGFGRLFKMKAVVELAKSVLKAGIFFAVLATLALRFVGPLASLPLCGTRCMGPMLDTMMKPLLGAAVGIYAAAGLADFLLQRWLFAREMRMTHTEVKRERKDQDGNPQIKGALRRLRNENSRGPKQGVSQTTVMVCSAGAAVGLRFVKGETALPIVVCRGKGARAAALVEIARERRIPTYWDEALAAGLTTRLPIGSRIPQHLFKEVAQALFLSGALRG